MQLNPEEAKRVAGALLGDQSWVAARPGTDAPEWRTGQFSPGAFGRYQLVRLVGVGGMGEVYEAEQESPRRQVALKVVRPELLSTEAAARFEHEARILGRLQHPGIAQIYEAGRIESNGCLIPYFAMEFVAGRPLIDYADEQRLSTKDRLELFLSVCDAVEHAHRKGVIHRDLKPGNILVDAAGHPRILDFGVARLVDADPDSPTLVTDAGRLLGTLAYMSPEQVSGDREGLDTRSDVYALGVLLYQLLSGKLPYELTASQLAEAARIIKEREPAPISTTNRALRGDIETIVRKSLAKERERRYQSVGELAADIRRYLRNAPIEAKPPSAMYQLRKFAVRNRGIVIATSLTVLAVAAGSVATVWFAWQQSRLVEQLGKAQKAEADHRALAERKQYEAEISSASAWQVTEFISQLIIAASPLEKNVDYTVREMVEDAARELDRNPLPEPLVDSSVRVAMGDIFYDLGQYQQALKLYQRARETRLAQLDESDPLTLETAERCGTALSFCGDHQAALELLNRSLPLAAKTLGADHRDVISMERFKALAQMRLGQYDEAATTALAAFEHSHRVMGADDKLTLVIGDTLAGTLYKLGRFAEGRKYWAMGRDAYVRMYGLDDMRTLVTRSNLATMDVALGDYATAEKELRAILAKAEELQGRDSTYADSYRHALATALAPQGQLEEAESLIRQVVEFRTAQYGARDIQTIQSRRVMCKYVMDAGKYAEALQLATDLAADSEASLGPAHPNTLEAMTQIARVALKQGDLEQCVNIARETWKRALDAYGSSNRLTVTYAEKLAVALNKQERFDEAKQILHDSYEAALTNPQIRPSDIVRTTGLYARALIKSGELEAAEGVLLDSDSKVPTYVETLAISDRLQYYNTLVSLYEKLGPPETAARYQELAEKLNPVVATPSEPASTQPRPSPDGKP